eukprot:scaffold145368_cov133-Phaeocystis_antarctica.AAC.2
MALGAPAKRAHRSGRKLGAEWEEALNGFDYLGFHAVVCYVCTAGLICLTELRQVAPRGRPGEVRTV